MRTAASERVRPTDEFTGHEATRRVFGSRNLTEIAAGTERALTGAGDDDHTDVGVVAGVGQHFGDLAQSVGSHCVVAVGSVDRDRGNASGRRAAEVDQVVAGHRAIAF
jgi:hypothetical protein